MSNSLRNFSKNITGAIGPAVGLAGVGGLVVGLGQAFSKIKEFEQATADLASVLGKSRSDIQGLKDNAKELGATTAFTATQVVALQTELAKLGFGERDIIKAAKAVEDFSIAVGTDAASAATVAGAALRNEPRCVRVIGSNNKKRIRLFKT